MTVYRRLKKAGISIETLREQNSGEITPAGANTIASLFDTPSQAAQQVTTDDAPRVATETATMAARLEAAQETIRRLEDERDRLIRLLDAANAALEREQDDRRHERQLLTGNATDGQQRRGWFGWFRR